MVSLGVFRESEYDVRVDNVYEQEIISTSD